MAYVETNTSWDYVGMTVYPLNDQGQRIQSGGVDVSYYLPDMGLYRVSNSNRYNDILTPTLKHTTVEVPGGDGTYWFGAVHTQKPVPIRFAYSDLLEENLHLLRSLFAGKKRLHIVLDEYPYKYYDVVVSQAIQFDYVPFSTETPRRNFKGESTMQLVSYSSYAYGTVKSLSELSNLPNYQELIGTTNLITLDNTWNKEINGKIKVYNAGDIPTDFILTVRGTEFNLFDKIILHFYDRDTGAYTDTQFTKKSGVTAVSSNASIQFDTKLHTIYDTVGGQYYNSYFSTEAFNPIPCSKDSVSTISEIQFYNGSSLISSSNYITIDYKYRFY